MMNCFRYLLLILAAAGSAMQFVLAQEPPSIFSSLGGVSNTRHNLTQRPEGNNGYVSGLMDNYRNNYGEVCVYCHTPHGAATNVTAPLWNRHIPATTYTTYDQLHTSTLTQTVYQPGAASLMCLSCHNGLQAVDLVLNMPGSGKYNATYPTTSAQTNAFLNTWNTQTRMHMKLREGAYPNWSSCLACHTPTVWVDEVGGDRWSPTGSGRDFTIAAIGTDLRNDHPVGVRFPEGTNVGWNEPNGLRQFGSLRNLFFDENNNGRMDKGEIRLYDSGNGPAVECASCHDPHGVPGASGTFNPTFLRKANSQSAVCMTCHAK